MIRSYLNEQIHVDWFAVMHCYIKDITKLFIETIERYKITFITHQRVKRREKKFLAIFERQSL
jgi:hypothetical protein